MDAYPDVLAAHWSLPRQGRAARVLDAIARFQLRRAALVLTLGSTMADRVGRRLADRSRLHTVPLWTDAEPRAGAEAAWRSRRGWSATDVVFLYSGNMGRGHRFDEFLEAARRLGRGGPVWAFVGGGPRRGEVERFRQEHADARVEALPYVAWEDVGASHRSADVHLVSLSSGWQGLIVPSKLQAAFSAGRPIIFVGPEENEMAAWIRESGGGWVVGEGDVEGLLSAVQAARDPAERAKRGRDGLEYARLHFDRERNCARIADLLERAATAGGDV
jgi:glycosyltransferase involved in cell wall biosynthesis